MRYLLTVWMMINLLGVDAYDDEFHFVVKKKHHRKHHSKKKAPHYSANQIEKILENVKEEGACNQLQCSSELKVAKKCLKTRKLRADNKKCYKAFCRYGCNDQDYQSKPEVFEYCNRLCPSKRAHFQ